ncbi:MAG: hypothetical protein FJW68_02435 [Actinobacteria bacterium]|nr:hypothetical protein [Actinomycetota bacterium]
MNKRNIVLPFLCIFISILLLFSLAGPGCAGSKDKFKILKADVFINGQKLETTLKPRLVNDVIVLPAQEVLAAMGAEVFYDEETQMLEAFKEDVHIAMYADADYASVNNMIRMLEAPLKLIEGQIMAPYSLMAEAFDCKVSGDEASGEIQIYTEPGFFDELSKSEIDFSVSASDIRFIDRSTGSNMEFIKIGNTFQINFKVFKNPGNSTGGAKAKLVLDGFHIDTIPFFIDKHNSYVFVSTNYTIPLNRYGSLAPDEIKNSVFSVEIFPDYMSTDTNLSNNKAEVSFNIKGIERKTNEVGSSYILDSIKAGFELTHNMARPGNFLPLISYIKGTGIKTILNYFVNGELISENFNSTSSPQTPVSHSRNYFVPYNYVGLINYEVQLDNGEYKFMPVPVAPYKYSVLPGSIRWQHKNSTKNYAPGTNLFLNALIMRDNKNDFTGPLRVYFLVNGELSPPVKVNPPSGTTPYLGDASYSYKVPQDAPPVLDVTVFVDPGQLLYEHDRSNNTYSVSIPETIEGSSGNDISISSNDLVIAPSYILPGQWIQLIATIKNNSKNYPDKGVRVIFKVNGEIIANGDYTYLTSDFRPGQGRTIYRMWKAPENFRGSIIFTVEIDPEGKLSGDDRSDNNASTETTVAKPDLSVEEKSLMPTDRLISGRHGTLKARINNFGPIEAENVHVVFYIDGQEAGRNIIDIMPAYSSFDVFAGITVPAFTSQADNRSIEGVTGYKNPTVEKKQISYSVTIDPSNLVEESNEDNNNAGPKELEVYVPSTKGTVHIKVTDLNHNAIENSEVVISAQNESASALTDSEGLCTFFHVPFGPFEATASKTGYRANATFDEYLHPGNIYQYAQIYLDNRSAITGHISTTSGAKLEGVKISANNSNEQIYTNSQGWYELRLAAGTYTINYLKAGYRPETINLTVGAGQDIVRDMTMQTTDKVYISGSAYDENGAILKNFQVKVVNDSKNVIATANTDLNGDYYVEVPLPVHETWIALQATHNNKSYSGAVYAVRGMQYRVDVSFVPVPKDEDLVNGQSGISGKVTPYVVCAEMPGTVFNPGYKVEAIYGTFKLDLFTMIQNSHMMYIDVSVVPDYWILTDVSGSWNPAGLLAIGAGQLAEKVICAIIPLSIDLKVKGHSLNKTKTWIKKISIISGGAEIYTSYPDAINKYVFNPNLPVNLNDCIVKLYLKVEPEGTGLNPAAGWGMDRVLIVWNPGNKKFEKIGQYIVINRDGYLDGIYMDY